MERRTFIAAAGLGLGTTTAGCTTLPTSSDSSSGSYSVSIEPMGEVEFDSVPDEWVALLPSYADMGFALGAGQSKGIQKPYRYASHFYDELPDVSYDPDAVATLNDDGVDKEVFYEIEADVHFMEPNQLINWYDWSETDVREIRNAVGPFFGNFIRRRSDEWHDYRYYSLYEAFEKVAEVFQRTDRYEEFAALHEDVIGDVRSRVPDEGPRAMLLYPAEEPPEKFYPYRLSEGGVGKKQWRDLNLRDAFAESDVGNYSGDSTLTIDYETLLEIDPDVLILRGQERKTRAEFEETLVAHLEEDQIANRLTAVQNGDVYQGGFLDQGPIINLFQTELAAKRIYSDEFTEERLFDRRQVADIVNGEF